MLKNSLALLTLLTAIISTQADAHRRWLMPTDFALSEAETVSFDFTASNNIFYVDVGLPLTGLQVHSPEGKALETTNHYEGKRRSVFDLAVTEPGTHRVFVEVPTIYFVSFQEPNNDETQWCRGKSVEHATSMLPSNAMHVEYMDSYATIETFVTLGSESQPRANGVTTGLTLVPVSHPNSLYADEPGRFQLLLHGKPAAGVNVSVLPDGMRYRDNQEEIIVPTDSGGFFSVDWPNPGRYLIEAKTEQNNESGEIKTSFYNYYLTLEVLVP